MNVDELELLFGICCKHTYHFSSATKIVCKHFLHGIGRKNVIVVFLCGIGGKNVVHSRPFGAVCLIEKTKDSKKFKQRTCVPSGMNTLSEFELCSMIKHSSLL
jgi:hypothetical protein